MIPHGSIVAVRRLLAATPSLQAVDIDDFDQGIFGFDWHWQDHSSSDIVYPAQQVSGLGSITSLKLAGHTSRNLDYLLADMPTLASQYPTSLTLYYS